MPNITVTDIGSSTTVSAGKITITVGAGGVPAGSSIFVCASENIGSGGATVADTASNTYAKVGTGNTGVNVYIFNEFTGKPLNNGDTIVLTLSGGGTLGAMDAFYVLGLASTAEGQQVATGTSSTPSVTSPTPTFANDFFVGAVAGAATVTSFTQDSTNAAWASPPGQVSISAPVLGGGWVINPNKTTRTYAPTFGTSTVWAAVIQGYLTAAPLGITDPNPTRSKLDTVTDLTWTDPVKLNLNTKDQFFTTAGRGPTYDYPNPRGQIPSVLHKTHIDPVKLELLSKDKFFFEAGRGPVYDYPNPRGPIPDIVLKTHTDNLDVEILSKDQFFTTPGRGVNFDWPNPTLRRELPVGINAQQAYIDWIMLDQTTPAVSINQWPNTPRAAPVVNFWTQSPLPIGGFTPNLNRWENPRGATPLVNFWLQSPLPIGGNQPVQNAWDNPRGQAHPLSTWLHGAISVVGPQPFTNYDWPNPTRNTDFTTAINSQLLYIDWLIVDQSTPIVSTNQYPNPNLLPRAHVSYNVRNIFAVPNPFSQYDWPNTLGKNRHQDWVAAYRNYLGTTPFNQEDWENPRGSLRYQDWVIFRNPSGTIPFTQNNWPNTLGTPYYEARNLTEPGLAYLTFIPPPPPPVNQNQPTPLMSFMTFAGLYRTP